MLNRAFRTALCAGALLLALCLPASAAQEGDFSVLVNGEAVTFTDAAPLLKDGRSFLPMVETFDALGFAQGDITWDAATRSVTVGRRTPLRRTPSPPMPLPSSTPPPPAPMSPWDWWPVPWGTT